MPRDIVAALTSAQINDAIKQNGQTSNMIFQIPRLIEHVSSIMTLEAGLHSPVPCAKLTYPTYRKEILS